MDRSRKYLCNPELIIEQKRKHLKEYIKSVFEDTISSDFDEFPEFFKNPRFLNDRILINYEGITIKQLKLQIDRCLLNADENPPSHIRAAERLANIPVSVPLENPPFSNDGLNEADQLIKLQKQRRLKVREKLKEVKECLKIQLNEAREVLKRIRKIQGRGRERQTEQDLELEQHIQEVEKRLEPQL